MARQTPQIKETTAFPPDLHKAFLAQVKRRKMTKGAFIREAVAAHLGRPELAEMRSVGQPRKRPEEK